MTCGSKRVAKQNGARGKQPNLSFFAFTATPKANALLISAARPKYPTGLATLDRLQADGAITAEEYASRRREILREI